MVTTNAHDNRIMPASKASSSKAACDRCRGQKLRCIWDPKESQCQRCARANAMCTVPLPRPMGRPPRQHRSASSSSSSHRYNRGHSQGIYSWAEESPPPPGSGDESADVLPMISSRVLSNPLDFLPWVPEPDGLNLFAPGGAIGAALTMASAMPNPSTMGDVSQPFSPHHEVFAATVNGTSGGGLVEPAATNHRDLDKEDDHMQLTMLEKGDDHIKLLTRLCELNVALYQHPLHREKDKPPSRPASGQDTTTQTQTNAQSSPSDGSPDLNLSDLGTGSLFGLTCRLKDIVTQIRALDEGAPQSPKRYDRSTALMALSCYIRLDVLYSRALEILVWARNDGQAANGAYQQPMPELVIDGFSMGQCPDLQLNFLIHLHEQAGERIRACIRSAEGTTRVARDRREQSRTGAAGPPR